MRLLLNYSDLGAVYFSLISRPPLHNALAALPQAAVVQLAVAPSGFQHIVKSADIQLSILRPALQFPSLGGIPTHRAANAAQAGTAGVV